MSPDSMKKEKLARRGVIWGNEISCKAMFLCLVIVIYISSYCQASASQVQFQTFQFRKERGPAAVEEGKQSIYRVLMDAPPENEVTLNLQTEVDGYIRTLTDRLTFNSTNWNQTREIVIVGVDDDIIRYSPYGGILNVTASTRDNSSLNATTTTLGRFTLLVEDTDEAGVVIKPKEVYPSYKQVPEGRWGIYEVSLPSKPTDTVFVNFQTIDSNLITLSPSSMVFHPDEWNIAKQLLVFAIEDDVNMKISPYSASFNTSLTSNDTNFHQEPIPDYELFIEDNDEDEAVISGSLQWMRVESLYPRTLAEFHLSLTLSTSVYTNMAVGDTLPMPGTLVYGDNTQADEVTLKVVHVNVIDDYLLAEGFPRHEYQTANHFGNPWKAVYEHCCRNRSLNNNNRESRLALSVTIDLNHVSSPHVPVLPLIHWTAGTTSQQQLVYYSALAPNENPLQYTLGNANDYRSAQTGSPQGITISSTTGLLSWETANVNMGGYSLQVVTEDIVTGLRVAAEVILRLTGISDHTLSPPTFPFLLQPTNLDNLYGARGSAVNALIEITYDNGGNLAPITVSPKLNGLESGIYDYNGKVFLNVSWSIPEDHGESYEILCQAVTDSSTRLVSPPVCLPVVITTNHTESYHIDLNGPNEAGYIHHTTYRHGEDPFVSLLPNDTYFSISSDIHRASISFATYHDGINETIDIASDFVHPSLKFEHVMLSSSPNSPEVLVISGISSVDVYNSALHHLVYKNTKGRPATGLRVIVVKAYNGYSGNSIAESYIQLNVEITNVSPIVKVNGDEGPYKDRYYPQNPPVPVINPTQGLVIDEDSSAITEATVKIRNPLDGGDKESLKLFYEPPESLVLPIVHENNEIHKPFGMLFSGQAVKYITDTIHVSEQGVVGDVNVVIDIRHSWIGDIKLELSHADRRVLLVLSPGGPACGKDNLFSTTFDTESSDYVELSTSTTSPGLCHFETQGLFTTDESLQSFSGDPIQGDWVLHITDLLTHEDSGRLVSWGLVIQPMEEHLVISEPAVVPVLTVGKGHSNREQHQRMVEADGRIVDMSVHVSLGVSYLSDHLHMPTLTLIHPDGTEITLSDGGNPLCAYGNYTHLVFDDRVMNYIDYSCDSLYNASSSNYSMEDISGIGSGSGDDSMLDYEPYLLNIFDLIDMNVTIPTKPNLIDVIPPSMNFSTFRGKRLDGVWTLVASSDYFTESLLLGWSIKVRREPNIDSVYDPISATLTLQGADSASNYQYMLRTIHYDNSLSSPDFSQIREIETILYDGESYSNVSLLSSISYITIHHIVIDLYPLNGSSPNFAIEFIEHGPPVFVADSAILIDPASESGLYSLIITLRNYGNGHEEGLLVNTSSFLDVIVDSYNRTWSSNEKVLVFNISATSPQSISNFEAILRSVMYFNNAEEFVGLERRIEFMLYDFIDGNVFTSQKATTIVSLLLYNDPPVLILNKDSPELPYNVSYFERQGEIPIIDEQLFILYDNDDDVLSSITVRIVNAMDGEDEILAVNETILEATWIISNYDNDTNTLVLSGIDTVENYTSVLSTITYENTMRYPGNPDPTVRMITFVANDGNSDGVLNITLVSFSPVNDPPFGDLNGLEEEGVNSTVVFREELGPIELVPSAVLFDVDNGTLDYITVNITNAYDGHLEVLTVSNVTEISKGKNKNEYIHKKYIPEVDYDSDTSTLIISGLESVYAYQQVLRTLTYDNLADEPHPQSRVVEIIMNDGIADSKPLYSDVVIELINDSPFIDQDALLFDTYMIEDELELENDGFAVSELSYLIKDDDVDSIPGIAITQTDTSNGVWAYSLDSGVTWDEIAYDVSETNALVLSAYNESGTRLRFLPDRDFNGNVTLLFVAWDSTDGEIDGSYLNAHSTSITDPFSSEYTEVTMIVTPVNDAPILLPVTINMTTILEDDYNSPGDTVLSFLEYVSDVDIADTDKHLLGIAIVSAEQQNGVWQYTKNAGESWTDFGSEVGVESALLLRSYPFDENRVRFVPNKDYNGYNQFMFLAWDLTYAGLIENSIRINDSDPMKVIIGSGDSGGSGDYSLVSSGSGSGSGSGFMISSGDQFPINGSDNNTSISDPESRVLVNITLSDPITGPLSVNSSIAIIRTEPVNDSPTVVDQMVMDPIHEDIHDDLNHGTSIDKIITGYYGDVDAHPMRGLAIVEVDNRFGVWQYRCNTTEEWEDFIGDVHFGFIVPPLPVPEKATLLLEDCWIRFVPDVHFNTEYDYDHKPRNDSDTPFIVAHGWDNTGLTEGFSGTYGNDASYADTSITNEYSYNTVSIPITITTVNDVPILWLANQNMSKFSTTFYEDRESVPAVGDELVLIDNDHARLRNATITIYGEFDESPYNETELDDFIDSIMDEDYSSNFTDLLILQDFVKSKSEPTEMELYCAGLAERTERLLIDVTYTDLVTEIVSYCPFTVHIYPDPDLGRVDADTAMFQKVLRTVRYNNSVQEPLEGVRRVEFAVYDDFGSSVKVTTTINVILINDAPILDLNDYTPDINNFVTYFEGDEPLVLVNSSGLRLVDFDNHYLQNAWVILVEAPDTINETLTADTRYTNIIADYENYTLYLTGNDTVENYAKVLATVTYYNNYSAPGNPDQTDREVLFIVSDGFKENLPAQTTINFIGINDKPSIDVNGNAYGSNYSRTFVEEEGPVPVTSKFSILVDEDNDTLAYVTAIILNPLDGPLETLSVSNSVFEELQKNNPLSNVTYNMSSSTLTITGLNSVKDYRRLLRTVMYNNDAEEFANIPRIILFIASDGLLVSNSAYTIVEMMPINDSPFFNNNPVIVPHIYEDTFEDDGDSVYSIAHDLIEDNDTLYMEINRGIAVVNVETDNGHWEYKIGSNWTRIPNDTDYDLALLLSASETTFVRFVPDKDFNGNASLSFVAWDGVDGMPEGTQRVATSFSNTDPFSDDTRTLTVVVVPVNDAPVLNSSHTIVFSDILEDDVLERDSNGEDVSIFFSALIEDVDQDYDKHEFGIAVVEADQTNGFWQVSTNGGNTWKNITSPTVDKAIILRSQPEGQHRIRFAPLKDFNGDTSLRFKLWDINVTYPSGTEGVDTNTDSITGTFSKDIGNATLTVEPVNDSPVLLPGVTLNEQNEDTPLNVLSSTFVRTIVNERYIDVDQGIDTSTSLIGRDIGIAVVGVDNRNGLWQYTCDTNDALWVNFIGGLVFDQIAPKLPNIQRATLLSRDCRIRFIPDENFNTEFDFNGDPRPESDTPFISIRAWDNTGNTEGMNGADGVDTTSDPDDHTNSFSKDIQNATLIVNSINDIPRVLIDGSSTEYSVVYTEPITPNRTVIPIQPVDPDNFEIVDVDNARLLQVIVRLSVYDPGMEDLSINVNDTTNIKKEVITNNEAQYRIKLSPINGSVADIEEFNTALRTLQYENRAEEPNPTTRSVEFLAYDEFSGLNSPSSETSISIRLLNDPPEIDLSQQLNDTYNIVSYSEGQGPETLVDPTLSLIDYDNTTLDHITVTITNLLDGDAETLTVNVTSTSINESYSNGTLQLQGPDSIENFLDVLLTLKYNNSLSHPGNPTPDTRFINIIANDGLNDSFIATVFLYFTAINNLPILDLNGTMNEGLDFFVFFREEEGGVSGVADNAIIIDVDNMTLEYVEVNLMYPLDGSLERLWVSNVTEYSDYSDFQYLVSEYKPAQHYNYTTGVLRFSGLGSVYEYQQVLRTLKYNNKADEPTGDDRMLSFRVSDGLSIREGPTTTIQLVSINDSPYVNTSADLYRPITFEDILDDENIGWSLEDLAANWILDDDQDAVPGVAVVAVDTSDGIWEYTLGGYEAPFDMSGSGSGDSDSLVWYSIPDNTSVSYATVIRLNSSHSRIRFIPNKDFNGKVGITLVAWDGTDGLEEGSQTSAVSQSHTDPFSHQSVMLTATIEPVNDAPVLNGVTINLTTILEDNPTQGDDVAQLLSGVYDIDGSDILGVAIVSVNEDNGYWEFTVDGGMNWEEMIEVSASNATLLSSHPPESNRIRFIPNQDYNGYSDVTFLAWDSTSGDINGDTGVDTTGRDLITGSFSTRSAQAVIYLEPVNDSPVVKQGMSITIYEDIPISENNGVTVSEIVSGYYEDVDAKSEDGLAVVGVNIDNGLWQYRCPEWVEWEDFIGDIVYGIIVPPLPRPEKATLLLGECRVRFLPNYLFNTYEDLNGDPRNSSDIPYIVVRGWDNTGITKDLSGHYGIDTTHNNDSIINELSSDTVKVLLIIESVNNPTELNITTDGDRKTYTILFTEDDPYIRIVDPLAVSLIDVDNATLESVTIELTNVYDSGDEWIDIDPIDDTVDLNDTTGILYVNVSGKIELLKLEYDIFNDTTDTVGVTNLTLTAYEEGGEVSKQAYEEAIRHLVYINEHSEPVNETRLVIFHINDGVDIVSNIRTYIDYKLLAENHPVLTTGLYRFNFTEGDSSPVPLVSSGLTLTDEDHNEFFYIAQALITIVPVPVSQEERVSVDTLSTVPAQYIVTQSYSQSNGQLLVYGDAPVNVYQDILRTAQYHNTIEEPPPGVRNISVVVTDSHGLDSNIEYVSVSVLVINDRSPVIITAQDPFYYYEHRVKTAPTEITIHENLTISDPDSGNLPLQWIQINLTNPLNGPDNEVLSAIETDLVAVSYTDGLLTLTGPAVVKEFQTVLSTLTYINTAEEPIIQERILTITAYDGDQYSVTETITIIIIVMNDPPVIDLNGDGIDINYVTEYEEGGPPVTIVNASELVITDNDDDNITQAIVKIETIYDIGKEELAVDTDIVESITVTYSFYDGVLNLEGDAPIEDYIDVLQTITYQNLESMPGNPNTTMRQITFTVYDQMMNASLPATTYLTFKSVNDAPFLDLNGDQPGDNYTTEFIEEGEPVFLSDENITLFDIDSDTIAEVRVRIINCPNGSLELLSISDTSILPNSFTYTSSICEFIVNGTAPTDVYQTLIGLLTYQNIADEPENEDRIIEIIVNDSEDDSEPRYTTVSVTEVNDPPRLQISPPPGVYNYSDFIIVNMTSSYTPLPSNATTNATNTTTPPVVASGDGSGIEGSGVEGSALDDIFGSGNYDPMDTDVPPTTNTPMEPVSSNVTTVNVTSPIYTIEYTENGPPAPIVEYNFVSVEDDDNSQLSQLQVIITNAINEGFENVFISKSVLESIPDADLQSVVHLVYGQYVSDGCPSNGPYHDTVNINLPLSLQQMTYLIQTLQYCNADNHPVGGDRNITLRIRDVAGDWSDNETAIVTVIPVNDAPIFNETIPFNDQISINEDTNITIPVLYLFYDYEEQLTGESIRVVGIEPDIGTAVVDPSTGDIMYYTALNDYGVRIVSYVACDSMDLCSSPVQNLTITVEPVNDPPYTIGNLTLVIIEDVETQVNLTVYFGDIEDDANSNTTQFPLASLKGQPTLVSVYVNEEGVLIITSRGNTTGSELLVFDVCDSNDLCTELPLTVIISPVNDFPEIIVHFEFDEKFFSTIEDTPININVTYYDIESTLDTPITEGVVNSGNGSVSIVTMGESSIVLPDGNEPSYRTGNLKQNMLVTYTPNTNFYGTDTITISATDFEGGVTTRQITIEVKYVNDPPYFGTTQVTTQEDVPLEIILPTDLNVTDPEDILNAGSFTIIQQPTHGTLTYTYDNTTDGYPPTGTLIYTPMKEYYSTNETPESFIIQACDDDKVEPTQKLCTNATITVVVTSSNDPPIVPVFTVEIDEEHVYTDNLVLKIIDVEEGNPPAGSVSLIEPLPDNGIVSYDTSTGVITYTPDKDFFGVDYIYFESCDLENSCNSSGLITINVLDINDPPVAMDINAIVREDVFELIDIHVHSSDSEDDEELLKISIVDSNTSNYMNDGEIRTSAGAFLRIYQEHGLITYDPVPNFVGVDSFRYAICDTCDVRRNQELGRTSFDDYPQCTKQLEDNDGNLNKEGEDVYITCDEAMVYVMVINSPDVPVINQLYGRILQNESLLLNPFVNSRVAYGESQLFFYSNTSASLYDLDDLQSIEAQKQGLNLTEFGLSETTDVDESSLEVGMADNGLAVINRTTDGLPYIKYTPNEGFSGYDEFTYMICDLPTDGKLPRCDQNSIHVFVIKPGPRIIDVTAVPAIASNGYYGDCRVSTGDTISIEFDQATNMPPNNEVNKTVNADQIDGIFTFPEGFIPPPLYPYRYSGIWRDSYRFEITVNDAGYPQPENKIGEWTVGIREIDERLCGGIDSSGNRIVAIDSCLLSSDTFSAHSSSISPAITGNWGLRLPELATVVISDVGGSQLLRDVGGSQLLGEGSKISLYLREPFSHNQLILYCSQPADQILDLSKLGEGVRMTVTGCENILLNSDSAFNVYQSQIEQSKEYFDVLDYSNAGRSKRQALLTSTEQPVVSRVILELTAFTSIRLTSTDDITRAFINRTTMAWVVSQLSGVDADLYTDYEHEDNLPVSERLTTNVYIEKQDALTPRITTVQGDDPNCLHSEFGNGDTIIIEFNRETNEPNIATKADIDRIFVFQNPIGSDYTGYWETSLRAVITITDTGESTGQPGRITFTPNYLNNETVFNESTSTFPTSKPHCYGINVCEGAGPTVGICDNTGASCRAYEPVIVIGLQFSGVDCQPPDTSIDWVYVLVALIVILIIVLLIVIIYFCYRKNKQKRQKEEAMRVVERWHKTPKPKVEDKEGRLAPWAKPPDVMTMRTRPDPFSDKTGPLKNLPEMVKRPPTAAADNLPALDTIPAPFVPRAGARIVPDLPSVPPPPLRKDSLPSLTPLGLPRITRQSQPAISPTADPGGVPTLGPLQGPLHLYAQRMSGPLSPTPASSSSLPGVLKPHILPPIQGINAVPSRRISGNQLPPLPNIPTQRGPPFMNKVTPVTSSDENITSTSDMDTEEGMTTSDSGGPQQPLKPLMRSRPSNLSIGATPLSPPTGTAPFSPTGRGSMVPSLGGGVPSMPLRKPSVDPFARPPALTSPTSVPRLSRASIGPINPLQPGRLPQRQPSLGGLPPPGPLRPPPLPPIPTRKPEDQDPKDAN